MTKPRTWATARFVPATFYIVITFLSGHTSARPLRRTAARRNFVGRWCRGGVGVGVGPCDRDWVAEGTVCPAVKTVGGMLGAGTNVEGTVMAEDYEGEEGVGLAAAIGQVRAELVRAVEEGRDSPVRFRAGPVELEFQVAISHVKGVNGGVRVSVISFGAKGERTSTDTHRVKVTLTPVDAEGHEQLIGSTGTQ